MGWRRRQLGGSQAKLVHRAVGQARLVLVITANMLLLLFGCLWALGAAARCPSPSQEVQLPNVTASGYLEVDKQGSRLFYMHQEAAEAEGLAKQHVPIVLWLQV
jgi:hypothetical protein